MGALLRMPPNNRVNSDRQQLRRNIFFFLGTILLLGPLVALAANWFNFLFHFRAAIPDRFYAPLTALIVVLVLLIIPLFELLALTITTAKRKKFVFGRRFWFSVAFGTVNTFVLLLVYRLAGLLLLIPVLILLGHMLYLQRHMVAEPVVQDDDSTLGGPTV